jgi:alpha-beta hydrolase superfamily lysophospholipase
MEEISFWAGSADGTRRFVRRWKPDSACRGIVHLIHGMAEHSGRYAFLGEKLAAAGFELWAADQRGHGKTADPAVNDAGRGGLLGHTCDRDGFFQIVRDTADLNALIAESRADAAPPLFILGHSWGSFVAQGFIESLGESAKAAGIAGAVLSGTRGPGGADIALGTPFLTALAALTGPRRPSRLAYALAFGSYNKPFRPNRSAFDWLSRDEAAVDAFAADPLCGRMCSAGFFRDMTRGLAAIHKAAAIRGIPRDLPVYILCGSNDPVGNMGEGPTKLVGAYRACGITDLEFVIYPDARHEPLNETNREEVCGDLIDWLRRHS